jgi:hypothetical protein
VATLMCGKTCLQDIMCSSEAIEDETDLISTARNIVLGSVGVNDLQSIWLVVVKLEGTVTCL